MNEEPLDSCGIQWSRETPQEPAPGDEEAHGPPRGKQVDHSSWNSNLSYLQGRTQC